MAQIIYLALLVYCTLLCDIMIMEAHFLMSGTFWSTTKRKFLGEQIRLEIVLTSFMRDKELEMHSSPNSNVHSAVSWQHTSPKR